nr:unnamed protein product [Callosobruchus analis]
MEHSEESSRGKRKAIPGSNHRNAVKKARVKGEPYKNSKGGYIPGKTIGVICSCRAKCFSKLSDEEHQANFRRFYALDNKDNQDVFLQGLLTVANIQRRRPRVQEGNKSKAHVFKYFVYKGTANIEVCLNAFTSVFAATRSRVRRLKDLAIHGKSPKDLRGKNPSVNKLGEHGRTAVRQHIESFPVKISHYSNKEFKYLTTELNLKIMYNLFKEQNPDINVSYAYYTRYFRENFSLRFARPQIDVCATCETLNNKIKDQHLNETAKRTAVAELMVHKRRSNKFYLKLKNETNESMRDANVLALAFDFMQNIQLPKTPVGDVFYYQQLTVSVFCIHNIKDNKAKMYIYHEGEAKKTGNEIGSFLLDYLRESSDDKTELHLFSDNCWGQNKNHTVIRMRLALTDATHFSKILHYFPVRGHSFLPCDRDFAIIKRKLRKSDRIFTIHQLTELILTSSTANKFLVKEVKTRDLYKKNCVSEETLSKNTPRNSKVNFNISTYSQFVYDSENKGCVVVSEFIDGAITHTFKLKQPGNNTVMFPSTAAYPLGKVPIKSSKMEHIKNVLHLWTKNLKDFILKSFSGLQLPLNVCTIPRTQLAVHLTRALALQECMKNEMENVKNSSKDIISLDLQQILPTPSLTVGLAFYLRRAWTYNLSIHECVSGQGSILLWAEEQKGEIASILLKYLTGTSALKEHLVKIGLLCLSGSNWSEKNTSNQ